MAAGFYGSERLLRKFLWQWIECDLFDGIVGVKRSCIAS